MSKPVVSIIVVNHNAARYVEQTICSVVDQGHRGYRPAEKIVVDCGSDDQSESIIRCYLDELDHVVLARGLNRSMAINEGLKRASGAFVMIVDSGDVVLPGGD